MAAKVSEGRYQRVLDVLIIVDTQMWTIKDLKSISDASSILYRTAIQAGIPDGIARSFKEELKIFKPVWRQAVLLMNMHG